MFFGYDSCGLIAQFALNVLQEIPDRPVQADRQERAVSFAPVASHG